MLFGTLSRVTLAALAHTVSVHHVSAHACPARAELSGEETPAAASRSSHDTPQEPSVAPRTRIAGIDSLRVISRVRFREPGTAPHVLDVSLAFPGRARVALRPESAQIGQRVLRYARGAEVYGFGPREATSTRLEGAARSDELLSFEARLAAFLWPEAHDWSGEGMERRAVIAGLGTLVAELAASVVPSPTDTDGKGAERELRPHRIHALRADGSAVESLEITGWRRLETRAGARAWPRGLCLSAAGAVVWDEDVLSIERPVPWVDEWFVPPDRRAPRDAAVAGLHAIDLSSAVVRVVEVPPVEGRPSSIDAALAFAKRMAAEERARGRVLESRVTLFITPRREPRTVRLVLADENASVPDGWHVEAPQPAWLVFFDSVDAVDQRAIDRLLLAAPAPEQDANRSLMLVVTDEPRGGVQLVLVDAQR